MMELLQGVVLGAIQGLTEFFPVSSSGHLVFVPALFGWPDQGVAFDTVVHGGTLLAVLAVFWSDIRHLCTKALRAHAPSQRLLAQIGVAAIPSLAVGIVAHSTIQDTFRSASAVAVSLAAWGIVLFIADRWSAMRPATTTTSHAITWTQTLLIGALQIIALIPGTSRSGITMTGGLFSGMDRNTAVTFSFLVSIPTIAAAFAYGLLQIVQEGPGPGGMGMLLAGFGTAALTGFWAIRFLRAYVAKHSFAPFVWYRLILAALILLFLT